MAEAFRLQLFYDVHEHLAGRRQLARLSHAWSEATEFHWQWAGLNATKVWQCTLLKKECKFSRITNSASVYVIVPHFGAHSPSADDDESSSVDDPTQVPGTRVNVWFSWLDRPLTTNMKNEPVAIQTAEEAKKDFIRRRFQSSLWASCRLASYLIDFEEICLSMIGRVNHAIAPRLQKLEGEGVCPLYFCSPLDRHAHLRYIGSGQLVRISCNMGTGTGN